MSADFKSFFWFYVSFTVVILIAFLFGKFLPVISLPVVIAETGVIENVQFSISIIIELVFIGPVFGPVSWKTYQFLWGNLKDPDWKEQWKKYLDVFYLSFITIIMMGASLHSLANWLHDLAKSIGMTSNQLYFSVYLWDEIISHYIIPAGFFGMLFINSILDSRRVNTDPTLERGEILASMMMAVGLGGAWTYALLEGQAAWFYGFISIASTVIIVAFKLKTRGKPGNEASKEPSNEAGKEPSNEAGKEPSNEAGKEPGKEPVGWSFSIMKNPYVLLTLVYSIVNIAVVIGWGFQYGLKDYVPFLFQPSEVPSALIIWIMTIVMAGILLGAYLVYLKRDGDLPSRRV
ncbi:MAG: hypothetical protein ACTSUE_14640 [Promethearchaeota archaeon]